MKKILLILLFSAITGACTKSTQSNEPEIAICFGLPAWLEAKKAEYASCSCLTGIKQGIYKDEQVFEVFGFDPRCNGFNIVYKSDGTRWFISSEKSVYDDYTANVKQQSVIWTCSKGEKK